MNNVLYFTSLLLHDFAISEVHWTTNSHLKCYNTTLANQNDIAWLGCP